MRNTTASDFRRRQKVVAAVDLVRVPAGTPGKILYVAGFRWRRYRVRFDNGVERSNLDGGVLADREEWEQAALERRRAEALAEQERLAAELREQVVATASH